LLGEFSWIALRFFFGKFEKREENKNSCLKNIQSVKLTIENKQRGLKCLRKEVNLEGDGGNGF
jgi:hypothetical protein